jgi:hypothetical protein
MIGRLVVLCVSCLLALPAAASAQMPLPENTQWYAMMRPERGGCIAWVVPEADRDSIIYRGKSTRTMGPYQARSQLLAELQRMGWERQNSNDDRVWVGSSGC